MTADELDDLRRLPLAICVLFNGWLWRNGNQRSLSDPNSFPPLRLWRFRLWGKR